MPQLKNGKDYLPTTARMTYNWDMHGLETMPAAYMLNKVSKRLAIDVCKQGIDLLGKQVWFERTDGPNATKTEAVPFSAICEMLHWKSFELENNEQTVRFTKDPAWEKHVEKLARELSGKKTPEMLEAEASATKQAQVWKWRL